MISAFYPPLLGGLSRWHGSSVAGPKVLNSLAYGAAYGYYFYSLEPSKIYLAAGVALLTAAMKSSANEAFTMNLNGPGVQRPSWIGFLTCSVIPRTPTRTQKWCNTALMIHGYMIAMPLYCALVIGSTHFVQAAYVLGAGALSEILGYGLGRRVLGGKILQWTQWGELLTGVIAGLGFLA